MEKFESYSYSRLYPQKGDYIVAILQNDDKLDLSWVFKATSSNYKTLYLANDKDPENKEVKIFQHLINQGEYIPKQEEIEENRKREEAKKSKSNIGENKNSEQTQTIEEINKKADDEFQSKVEYIYSLFRNPIVLVVPGIIFIVILYVVNYRQLFLGQRIARVTSEVAGPFRRP